MTQRGALIDRDGTVNVQPPEHEYVSRVEDFHLLPGALEGIAALASCGYVPAIVSNQRGVARGMTTREALGEIDAALQAALEPHGVRIAGFYYCTHGADESCDCRKPRPGLLLQAAAELELDLAGSWMIGDTPRDVEAGRAAGARTAYLGSDGEVDADLTAASLGEAASLICP